jgi:hypothetical protein
MPPIAKIGTEISVTPEDDVQIISRPGQYEFTSDRSPFSLCVSGLLEEAGRIIGVYGQVIAGHQRYRNQIATLFVRLDHSNWRRDNRSAANFKVGRTVARPNGKHPYFHPNGTDIEGFPICLRFGSLNARSGEEPEINSAREAFQKSHMDNRKSPL